MIKMCELWCCEATCNCDDPVLKKHNFSVLCSNTAKKSVKSTKKTHKHHFLWINDGFASVNSPQFRKQLSNYADVFTTFYKVWIVKFKDKKLQK